MSNSDNSCVSPPENSNYNNDSSASRTTGIISKPKPLPFSTYKTPTLNLTLKQILYIVLVQGFIASGISFAINYGIAVAVFKGNDPPTMWQFPIPIAGNFGVLCIVEMFIIYLFDGTLILMDMHNGLIEPIHPKNNNIQWFWPKSTLLKNTSTSQIDNNNENPTVIYISNYNKFKDFHWWMRPPELFIKPTSVKEQSWRSRIYISCVRSIPWILVGFFLTWPIFVGVSFAIWGNDNYNSYPQPQWMSATYGGVLILCTNPWLALITMIYVGERICREKEEASNSRRSSASGSGRFTDTLSDRQLVKNNLDGHNNSSSSSTTTVMNINNNSSTTVDLTMVGISEIGSNGEISENA